VLLEHVIPDLEIVQALLLSHIIDHHCAISVLHVIRNQATESFLTSSVPQLNAVLVAIARDVLDVKIYAHC
jgi:hypothetical protein